MSFTNVTVTLDLEATPWDDITPGECAGAIDDPEGQGRGPFALGRIVAIGALPGGMSSGLPSVAVRIELPNGQTAVAETSARCFVRAAEAIRARYPLIDAN